MNSQMLMIFVGIATVAGVVTRDSAAQSPGSFTAEPTELEFGVKVEADDFPARARPGSLGLKFWSNTHGEQSLPLGIGYGNNANDVTIPRGDKTDWSLGLRFNLNSSQPVESSPNNGLGLQRKPAPGIVLERRF